MRDDFVNSKWIDEFRKERMKTSVDEKGNSLIHMLEKLEEKHVPKIKISGKPTWKNKGSFPLDKNTREALKEKSAAFRAWMRANHSNVARLRYTLLLGTRHER